MNGTSFCPNCGAPTTELTEMCPKCGARVAGKVVAKADGAWMPLTAGILDLIAGVPALIIGILFLTDAEVPSWLSGVVGFGVLMGTTVALVTIFAVIAVVGGVFALRKRTWGLALAGSIFAVFCAWILGIPAIVFTVMGKKHFK